MKTKLLFTILIVFSLATFAQVPRTVLWEHFTNASCGPCADSNPASFAYLESNYDNIVAIWYHGWWPGATDPMYLSNVDENRDRIGYYAINSVPRYVIDGVLHGYGDEAGKRVDQVDARLAIDSPVKLNVTTEIVNDSLEVTITLVVYGDVTQENLKLRTGVIEQYKNYFSPPGSNGEFEFPHVFNKFIGGVDGIDVSGLNIGDSLTYELMEEINQEWNRDALSVVAFLQSNSSKAIVQAAVDNRYHSISSEVPQVDLVDINKTTNYPFSITNTQSGSLELEITLNMIENNQNWITSLMQDGISVDTIFANLATDEKVGFELDIKTGDIPDYMKLSIVARNSSGFAATIDYFALVKSGDIMLIDDDGGKNFDENFTRALGNSNSLYTKIDSKILNDVKKMFDMPTEYKAILWNMGDYAPSLVGSDFSWLLSYLNSGGRVLFSGCDFAHDIHDVQNFSVGKFFFRNYLDAAYLTDSVTSTSLSSVASNPLFDTLNIQLNKEYSTLPDGVNSGKGESHLIMKFDDTDYYGIVLREKNDYKTAYITFGLEQISSEATQDLVVNKILDWFATPVVGVDENSEIMLTPKKYSLEQNYPNPFNPSTIINYQIPESGNVKVVVHDILGNEVAHLVNERKNAGYHSIEFNASYLTSGIYFYSIQSGNFYQVKKMLLIK